MFNFLQKRRKQSELCMAIYQSDFERFKTLVEEGLDLNFASCGTSPLCKAVHNSDRRFLELLLSHGAVASGAGNQSLIIAAAVAGNHQIIDLALAAGQDIHFKQRDNASALQAAAFKNRPDTINYLISRGATREDFNTSCSWRSINSATLDVLLKLGVEVPQDVIDGFKSGVSA